MKTIFHFLKELLKDTLDQAWTLVALIIGWLVLEGNAKTITGNLIMFTLIAWWITFWPFRYEKPEEDLPRDGDGDGYIFDGTDKERKYPKK